jgi:hypothetical protein
VERGNGKWEMGSRETSIEGTISDQQSTIN